MSNIQLNMVNRSRLESLTTNEKLRLIMDTVTDGEIIILEEGLSPEEEGQLIEQTMSRISPDTEFTGVEIETQHNHTQSNASTGFFKNLLSSSDDSTPIMIIGPSGTIQTLEKSQDMLSTLVSA